MSSPDRVLYKPPVINEIIPLFVTRPTTFSLEKISSWIKCLRLIEPQQISEWCQVVEMVAKVLKIGSGSDIPQTARISAVLPVVTVGRNGRESSKTDAETTFPQRGVQ